MPTYKITGTKEGKDGKPITIGEQAVSAVKADWVAAYYREHGYTVKIEQIDPLTSGSR